MIYIYSLHSKPVLFTLLIVFASIYSQAKSSIPPSFGSDAVLTIDKLPVFFCKDINPEDIIPDSKDKSGPFRFGHEIYTDINPLNHGIWEITKEGKIWRIIIESKEAQSLNFVFEHFTIPAEAELYIYTPCRLHILSSHRQSRKQKKDFYATVPLPGSRVIIEYFQPHHIKDKPQFTIHKIIHGYKNIFGDKGFGDSDYCHVNTACPEGEPWKEQIRSVVKIINGGSSCTGTLINNTAGDGTPYLLTANHCYSDPAAMAFWFQWESQTCDGPMSEPEYKFLSGASSIARGSASDFWLLKLEEIPQKEFNPYYAGWNRTEEPTYDTPTTSIHHPEGDIKKISWTNENLTTTAYGGGTGNTHWRVPHWSGGTSTEGGSSGAALFDEEGRILGQLEGGFAACGNTESDFFGRFNISWKGESLNTSSLKSWLDPGNTDELFISGFDPYENSNDNPILFTENFKNEDFPPSSWEIISASNNTWQQSPGYAIEGDPPITISPLRGNYFAYVAWTDQEQQEEWLITPALDFTDIENISLSFFFNGIYYWSVEPFSNSDLTVKYQIQNQDWQEVWNDNEHPQWNSYEWNHVKLYNLEDLEGKEEVRFAFVYRGIDGANFNLDSITIRKNDIEIVPDFNAYPLEAMVGDFITFEDLSTGSPIESRLWNFGSGAVPATATGPGPHAIIYSTIGKKNVSLTLNNEITLTKHQYIVIDSEQPCAPIYSFPFEENFNGSSALPDCWTKESTSEVTWLGTSGYNIGDIQIKPFKGTHFFDCGWIEDEFQSEWIYLPPFNLSGLDDPAISFHFNGSYYWSVEPNNNCDLDVLISTDGVEWKRIWNESDSEAFIDNSFVWINEKISLENFTSEEKVHLAFRYSGINGANFGIDNIMVGNKNALRTPTPKTTQIAVYPNPFQNIIQVNVEENISELRIYNIIGNKFLHISNPSPGALSISTEKFPEGVYVLIVKKQDSYRSSKIIIKKQ